MSNWAAVPIIQVGPETFIERKIVRATYRPFPPHESFVRLLRITMLATGAYFPSSIFRLSLVSGWALCPTRLRPRKAKTIQHRSAI